MRKSAVDGEPVDTCPKCGFIFWGNPKPVASLLIVQDGKILMIQRSQEPLKGYWCLPGGFIRWFETPEQALIREVKEETGLNAKITRIIGVYQIDNDPRGIHLDIIYEGRANGKVKINLKEHQKFDFFEAAKLPKLIAYKHREAIKDWVD
ncbi:MAG: NUDIX hydrolase [bacterium]|nr:NUDIX hydrolase [bacterium]